MSLAPDNPLPPPVGPLEPIGLIRSPHENPAGTPIQPSRARDARGQVLIHPRYADALADLDGFERIWLVYWFHRVGPARLTVTPFLDDQPRGLFATRAPTRPNPIGLSCVRLIGVEGTTLEIADVDVLDGTPLLDVKPYVPGFDSYPDARAGWVDRARIDRSQADDRFAEPS